MAAIASTAARYMTRMRVLIAEMDVGRIDAFSDLLFEAWRRDRRVFIFGNGGSGYTASHYVMDLVKTASVAGQKRLQCFSLVDNGGLLTALGNDISYDETFVFPLSSYARAGDVAVAISCSGNSPNVLKACAWAKENGLTLVCLSGFSGGRMAAYADLHINVPHENYGMIEDLHLSIGHMVAQDLRARVESEAPAR
jgi:D-sedoheptulose 7-phosphate isomerase